MVNQPRKAISPLAYTLRITRNHTDSMETLIEQFLDTYAVPKCRVTSLEKGKELELEHFHLYLESCYSKTYLRKQIIEHFDVHGNKDYEFKECEMKSQKYIGYIMKDGNYKSDFPLDFLLECETLNKQIQTEYEELSKQREDDKKERKTAPSMMSKTEHLFAPSDDNDLIADEQNHIYQLDRYDRKSYIDLEYITKALVTWAKEKKQKVARNQIAMLVDTYFLMLNPDGHYHLYYNVMCIVDRNYSKRIFQQEGFGPYGNDKDL